VLTPERQPRFFLDRSLGRVAVPSLLRGAGWDLVTLAEHYGIPDDERVLDTQWLRDAAEHGWPVLMKDKRIRYRRAEIDAVIHYQAQCFVITRGDLSSGEMASRFLTARRAIFEAVTRPGPYIYAVQSDRIDRIYPPPS
jgi:PIN like domain